MGLLDDLEDLLDPLFAGVRGLFGDDDDDDDGGQQLSPEELNQIVNGGNPPQPGATPPPQLPGGPSGLQQGADQAGTAYQQSTGAVAVTDEKLAELLKQIFASNDDMRAKISGIINGIESAHRQLLSNPQLANDPHALAWFNHMLDSQLGQIQQLLDNAKVDSQKQAELLAALADEYRNTSGDHSKDRTKNGGSADGDGGGGSHGGGGDGNSGGGNGGGSGPDSAGGGPDSGGGAPAGVTDPLAGLGGLPGAGMGDPLSMLGPALAGLGSLPGALGGAGSALPMDALGGLAPLASQLAGQAAGDGFNDSGSRDHSKPADFVDDSHGKSDGDTGKTSDGGTGKDDGGGKKPETSPAGAPAPGTGVQQPAPAAAVPASAPGDPGRVVQMPDGSPVTAPSAQSATAMRAVLNGASVTDGWKQANVQLPPPGTPVTAPADPAHLVPGVIAQFKSRDPVMYMGIGKIWLDGQLQPQSALPTGDFLGWLDPSQQAGSAPAPSPTATPPSAPAATNTSGA